MRKIDGHLAGFQFYPCLIHVFMHDSSATHEQ